MYTETLIKIFTRDLNSLKKEIMLYSNENNLWVLDKSIANSSGNLCLHLIGNLNHFIGAVLGNTGYVRHRKLEFSKKNVARTLLVQQIDETFIMVESSLRKLQPEDIAKLYPIEVFNEPMTTEYFLTHLVHHFSYHLGQINYHRRLLDV
ncbi:DinB family protein [Cognatitamlana onchidii]|uniref:DinB family protein n=1 Tax=Cognatitamlana onchidii TaxID=2562860 RepID=UPI0010A64810|nr:DinB family protein [Algibacter onchidii]